MATVHKKHTGDNPEPSSAKATEGQGEKSQEVSDPIVVSDVVTETTERVEVIEEVSPESSKSPLEDFKEKMKEEDFPPYNSAPKKNFMWPIIFIFVIALLLLGGVFIYKQGHSLIKINEVTLTPAPTITPVPTVAVDLTKYSIKILNGSGVDGEASRQKASLEGQGFTIDSVGNASNSDYTDTIIEAKKDVEKAFLDKLTSALEISFTIGTGTVLPDSSASPVIIILGTKK